MPNMELMMPPSTNSTYKNEIVLTCGVFDIIHAGHIDMFEWVYRELVPNHFIVAVNTDESLAALGRLHIHSYEERVKVVKAIYYVNATAAMHETDPTTIIYNVRPDIFVKGGDYLDRMYEIPEYKAMQEIGGKLLIYPHKTHSSREIITKCVKAYYDDRLNNYHYFERE